MSGDLKIIGEIMGDYFRIQCENCGTPTKNVYQGWAPAMPSFKATCEKCNKNGTWKLDGIRLWKGLPPKSHP